MSDSKLLDGYYKVNDHVFEHWKVDGNNLEIRDPHGCFEPNPKMEYGDFGLASEGFQQKSGKLNCIVFIYTKKQVKLEANHS